MPLQDAWQHIQSLALRLSTEFQDAVFIGGVAVYYHAARLDSRIAESSHDGDLYLSLLGKSTMRDRYEMQRNERLGKDSVLIEGEDFDVYVERQHSLAVPYNDVIAYAETIAGVRVAALEHLLILKLDAALNRRGSGKGEKDERDITRILALLDAPKPVLLRPFVSAKRREMLDAVIRRRDIFTRMGLNDHEASRLRNVVAANALAVFSDDESSEETHDGV